MCATAASVETRVRVERLLKGMAMVLLVRDVRRGEGVVPLDPGHLHDKGTQIGQHS